MLASSIVRTVAALVLAAGIGTASAQAPPAQFAIDLVYNSPNGITTLAFDHAGRLYAAEKQGRIVQFGPNGSGGYVTPPSQFATFTASVDTSGESGLLGLELDPDYANNRYLYVFYTTPTDQRVVRMLATPAFDGVVPGSELVLLSGLPRVAAFHKAGDIHFSPADPTALYVALGDDNQRGQVQNPDRYEGKMLRIDAATGLGLASNPYYAGNPNSVRARVWAVGFRNPWRYTFDRTRPSTSVMYVSENGDGTDRLSRVLAGSNGGWNNISDADFLNPPDPNHRVLGTFAPFLVGIAISPSGPFGTDVLYLGRGGAGGFTIRRFQLSGAGLDTATPLDGAGTFAAMSGIDLKFGPDGHLYGCSTIPGAATTGGPFAIRRLRFAGGAAPNAMFAVSPSDTGAAPFTVTFTDQSTDDGTIVGRAWTFGDGAVSADANPMHVYASPGVYTATLTVTDDSGLTDTAERTIRATRSATVDLSAQIFDARNAGAPPPLGVATELRFYQSDAVTPIAVAGGIGASGNALVVPPGGAFNGSIALTLTGNSFVVSGGEPASDGVHAAYRGYVIGAGAGPHTIGATYFLSDTMVYGRVRDTRDTALAVDVGSMRGGVAHAVPGGRDFLVGSGYPATGVAHRVVSDALGWYHVALRAADAGSFTFDAVADTGGSTHARVSAMRAIAASTATQLDLVAGLWQGGTSCDDLGAIAPLPSIDYATQVQPIWDTQCTGCHAPGATNSAGLDLMPGASFAGLVGVPSVGAPGVPRVTPSRPDRSFLMEKINCAEPQSGTRMRPANAMTPGMQATVRDWIASLSAGGDVVFANGFE